MSTQKIDMSAAVPLGAIAAIVLTVAFFHGQTFLPFQWCIVALLIAALPVFYLATHSRSTKYLKFLEIVETTISGIETKVGLYEQRRNGRVEALFRSLKDESRLCLRTYSADHRLSRAELAEQAHPFIETHGELFREGYNVYLASYTYTISSPEFSGVYTVCYAIRVHMKNGIPIKIEPKALQTEDTDDWPEGNRHRIIVLHNEK